MSRRIKVPCAVLTFSTTAAAIAMETSCSDHAIPGRLIPTPVQITAECGLAWKMNEEEYGEYKELIRELNIPCQGPVFLMI